MPARSLPTKPSERAEYARIPDLYRLKGGTLSRYMLLLIVLAALSLAATAGNIIWGP